MPGSAKDLTSELGAAPMVFTGRLLTEGHFALGPPGSADYIGAKWELAEVIKGETPQLLCTYRVSTYPRDAAESMPAIGEELIFIGKVLNKEVQVDKMLKATP